MQRATSLSQLLLFISTWHHSTKHLTCIEWQGEKLGVALDIPTSNATNAEETLGQGLSSSSNLFFTIADDIFW